MKTIHVETITLNLSKEEDSVRVLFNDENIILKDQTVDAVHALIETNFGIVVNHFNSMVNNSKDLFDSEDLNQISVLVVLHYIYMYNSWRINHRKHENEGLIFQHKDFDNPSTHDLLFHYFKHKYPDYWEQQCAILLGMNVLELRNYYKSREDFYSK